MHPKVWKRDFPAKKEDKMRHTAVLLLLFGAICCYADTIYVDDDGLADFNNIQDAINFAVYGDTIQVAEGTYVENITLKNGVALIGQDPNYTVIDGNDNGSVVTSNDCDTNTLLQGFTITNGLAERGGGMYNYKAGFTIADCNFIDNSADFGGGIYNYISSPTITYCTFNGNSAKGGGIYNYFHSRPDVTGCTFIRNTADDDGGGMVNYNYSKPNVTNCNFIENMAGDDGGGMYNKHNSSPTVVDCNFSGNTADGSGGGMYNEQVNPTVSDCNFVENTINYNGAGMYNKDSDPTVSNCFFRNNETHMGSGAGMCNHSSSDPNVINCLFSGNTTPSSGGGMSNSNDSNSVVLNCTFIGNVAGINGGGAGGGMYSIHCGPTVTNCIFISNLSDSGGGMININSQTIVTNCTFTGNSAVDWIGGGMLNMSGGNAAVTNCVFIGNSAYYGGGMLNNWSNTTVTNCSFSGNMAVYGGGVLNDWESYPELTNCILWGDIASYAGDEIYNQTSGGCGPSVPVISYSDIAGCGSSGTGWDSSLGTDDGGNIDIDPLFVDADTNDIHLQSEAGRWDANSQSWVVDSNTSPCIDAGDWATPIGFEPFPNGGRVNMGAYGGTAEASKSYFGGQPCETIIAGDINGDCIVNFVDFAIMAMHWLEDARP